MPNNPYAELPNLTGDSGQIEDIRSQGDPSRFFPSARRGDVDAVTGRILDVPRCGLWSNSALNLTVSGAAWIMLWTDTDYDTDGMFDLATPTRITIHTRGLYSFTGAIAWGANAFGDRLMYFVKNSTWIFGAQYAPTSSGAVAHYQSTAAFQQMNAGDYCEIWGVQNTAVGVTMFAGRQFNNFQACLISTFGSDNQ